MKNIVLCSLILLSFFSISPIVSAKKAPVATTKQQPSKLIDLNKATTSDLNHAFNGIGMRRAEAIVAYRSEHGPFKTVAELADVKRIGKAYVKQHLSELEKVFTVKS